MRARLPLACGSSVLLLCLAAACTDAQVGGRPETATSVFIGGCDLMALRARAVTIVDNADPDFASERPQYRMELFRRSPPSEIVLYHVRLSDGERGGGYAIAFDAETCKLSRLTPQPRSEAALP